MVVFMWLLQAMQDFAHLCQEKDSKVVLSVLPLWPKLYAKLSIVSYSRWIDLYQYYAGVCLNIDSRLYVICSAVVMLVNH